MRTFIAIPLPPSAKKALLSAQESWRLHFEKKLLKASWSREEAFHLTLKFLGEVGEEKIEAIQAALREGGREFSPFELRLEKAGSFPNAHRPRVLMVSIESEILSRLAAKLDEQLEPLGFQREKRRFNGHVTLARVREDVRLDEVFLPAVEPVSWQAKELILFKSELSPQGSKYEHLFEMEF
ncbi:MAG TPA: RNA 2',3'-cyclic phosphodiesterase [Chroococcales cyanobacterium]